MIKFTKILFVLLAIFSVTSAAFSAQPQLKAKGKTNLKRDYTVFLCPRVDEMKYWTGNVCNSVPCWTAGADSGLGGTKDWAGTFPTKDNKRPEFAKNEANQIYVGPLGINKNTWLIQCVYAVKNGSSGLFSLNITPDDGFKQCETLTTTSVGCYKN